MVQSSDGQSGSSRLERLERIYEENPGTRLFLALAEEYCRDQQLEKAVEVCRNGLESFPGYTSARVTLARSLIDLGQDPEAEKELGEVLGNSPDNLVASRLLASLMIRQGRREQAEPVVNRLLELSPDDAEGLRLRQQLEQVGEAPAAPAEPAGEEISTTTLARLYEEQGLHEKALGVYRTLLTEEPDNPEIVQRVAALEAQQSGETDTPEADTAEPIADHPRRRTLDRLGLLRQAARSLSPDRQERD